MLEPDAPPIPGVPNDPVLTPEPLGTQGQVTPGPDHLDPERPQDRRELIEMGYLDPAPVRGGTPRQRAADPLSVDRERPTPPITETVDDPAPTLPPLF